MSEAIAVEAMGEADDPAAVIALWQRAGLTRPWNDPAADLAFARAATGAAVLILRDGEALAASVMVGHDGHRGAVYYLAVDPARQGEGLGRRMMAAAEEWLRQRGVLKLNLMVRPDNTSVAAFYDRLGYAREERIVLTKRL